MQPLYSRNLRKLFSLCDFEIENMSLIYAQRNWDFEIDICSLLNEDLAMYGTKW